MAKRGNPNWQKGESGNPGGRRKDDPRTEFWRQFRDAIAQIKLTLALEGKPKKSLPCVEALTLKLVKWAMAEVEVKLPVRDDEGKIIGTRKEILPIPQNPQMVKLFLDKCLGSEMILSGSIGVDIEMNAIAEALAQAIPKKTKGKKSAGS